MKANKPVIREIIVVEGYSDLRAVKAAVDAEVIVTSGFMISAETCTASSAMDLAVTS